MLRYSGRITYIWGFKFHGNLPIHILSKFFLQIKKKRKFICHIHTSYNINIVIFVTIESNGGNKNPIQNLSFSIAPHVHDWQQCALAVSSSFRCISKSLRKGFCLWEGHSFFPRRSEGLLPTRSPSFSFIRKVFYLWPPRIPFIFYYCTWLFFHRAKGAGSIWGHSTEFLYHNPTYSL